MEKHAPSTHSQAPAPQKILHKESGLDPSPDSAKDWNSLGQVAAVRISAVLLSNHRIWREEESE